MGARLRGYWCSERLFLSHGAGSNGVKNVIIAFPVLDFTSSHIITRSAI